MEKQVLFFQGGAGKKDHEADARLVDSLQKELGETYKIRYPLLPEGTEPDFGRIGQIGKEVSKMNGEIILVGHSLGASMLLKFLSEKDTEQKIAGLFLISTPFWSGNEDWKSGLKLHKDFAEKLPKNIPVFLYHCEDDEEVPIKQLSRYEQQLPHATVRKIKSGGHQLNNDLTVVAKDIKSI